jgi:hypothetical protein
MKKIFRLAILVGAVMAVVRFLRPKRAESPSDE